MAGLGNEGTIDLKHSGHGVALLETETPNQPTQVDPKGVGCSVVVVLFLSCHVLEDVSLWGWGKRGRLRGTQATMLRVCKQKALLNPLGSKDQTKNDRSGQFRGLCMNSVLGFVFPFVFDPFLVIDFLSRDVSVSVLLKYLTRGFLIRVLIRCIALLICFFQFLLVFLLKCTDFDCIVLQVWNLQVSFKVAKINCSMYVHNLVHGIIQSQHGVIFQRLQYCISHLSVGSWTNLHLKPPWFPAEETAASAAVSVRFFFAAGRQSAPVKSMANWRFSSPVLFDASQESPAFGEKPVRCWYNIIPTWLCFLNLQCSIRKRSSPEDPASICTTCPSSKRVIMTAPRFPEPPALNISCHIPAALNWRTGWVFVVVCLVCLPWQNNAQAIIFVARIWTQQSIVPD